MVLTPEEDFSPFFSHSQPLPSVSGSVVVALAFVSQRKACLAFGLFASCCYVPVSSPLSRATGGVKATNCYHNLTRRKLWSISQFVG